MAEIRIVGIPERGELRRTLRARLPDLGLSLRVLAEDLLGGSGPIDLLAVDPDGGAVLVLVGGEGEDLALVGRALAERSFVEPRLEDWLKLAPRLGIDPRAPVHVLLLAPSFGPAALAAAGALGPGGVDLGTYRCVRNGGAIEALLERVRPPARLPAGVSAPRARFRSGLADADLAVTPEERSDLE